MFGLTTQIPRSDVPGICQGLAYLALERNGGFYYYPRYEANKMAAAFEWYLPHRNRRFGFKVGVEFWVDSGNLETLDLLFSKPLEPIRQFRSAFPLVCKLRDEQRERLRVTRDA